jgi:hypothetical protein
MTVIDRKVFFCYITKDEDEMYQKECIVPGEFEVSNIYEQYIFVPRDFVLGQSPLFVEWTDNDTDTTIKIYPYTEAKWNSIRAFHDTMKFLERTMDQVMKGENSGELLLKRHDSSDEIHLMLISSVSGVSVFDSEDTDNE